jgi:hypothetical protein
MMWYLTLMCLVCWWNFGFHTNRITTWLLLHNSIKTTCPYPRSPNNLRIQVISLVATCVAIYSTFVVFPMVQSYLCEPHVIGPPLNTNRKLDQDFQSFKSMAKLASQYECETWFLLLPQYVILIEIVPYKYFMIHFNVVICCICKFLVNLVTCVTVNEMWNHMPNCANYKFPIIF